MFRSRATEGVFGTCPWRHAWCVVAELYGFVNLSLGAGLRPTKERLSRQCSFERSRLRSVSLLPRPFPRPGDGQQNVQALARPPQFRKSPW